MFRLLSPDGFDFEMDAVYPTEADAEEAFESFRARYEAQGYYSTGNRERIDLEDLASRCSLIPA